MGGEREDEDEDEAGRLRSARTVRTARTHGHGI